MPSESREAITMSLSAFVVQQDSTCLLWAINEEKRMLLGTQSTRPTTIEMTQSPVGKDDGVIRRERPRTRRTDPRLLFHADPQSKPIASAGDAGNPATSLDDVHSPRAMR